MRTVAFQATFLFALVLFPGSLTWGKIPFQFSPRPNAKAVLTDYVTAVNVTGGSNQTIGTNRALGEEHPGRAFIIGIYVNDTDPSTINSVSLAGVTATQRYQASNGNIISAFYTAVIPTGTTGNVVVNITNSGTIGGVSAALWSVTGLRSLVPLTTAASSAAPATATVSVEQGGFALAYAASGAAGGSPSCTWTGLAEVFDYNPATSTGISGASFHGFVVSLSVTATWTATTSGGRNAIFATWR